MSICLAQDISPLRNYIFNYLSLVDMPLVNKSVTSFSTLNILSLCHMVFYVGQSLVEPNKKLYLVSLEVQVATFPTYITQKNHNDSC